MQIGFTIVRDGNEVDCLFHGEATRLVSTAQTARCAVWLVGRLHYRSDRLARLQGRINTQMSDLCQGSDAGLVLALFEEFGPAALEELEGDYAVAVWDRPARQIYGSRDPMGGYPLFWSTRSNGFALGTSMGVLLAFLGRRAINRAYIADYLTIFGQQNEGQGTDCIYEGINRVLPGSIVTLDCATNSIHTRKYWDWIERIEDPGTDCLARAGEAYGDRLRRAIAERQKGCSLAHLSGGMDSTGIALLAAAHVALGLADGPLHCASVVYDRLPKLGRERPFVEEVLRGFDPAIVHRVAGDNLLDFDAYTDAPVHDEPYPGLWRLQMDRALIECAADVGAETVLTGIGADEICAVQPFHLADWLGSGRLLRVWREAGRWARGYNCSKWELLRQFAFTPLGWNWLAGGRHSDSLLAQSDTSIPPWVKRDFAAEHDLRGRLHQRGRQVYAAADRTLLSVTVSGLRAEAGDPVRWMLAAPVGLAIAHPFLDPRVLTLGLGVQRRIMPEPGRMKPLLAEALRDVLPASILRRRAKGHFDEVYYLGLARNLPKLEAMVRSAPIDDLGIFDKARLTSVLEEASLAGPDGRKLQRLDHTLALVKWLSHEKEWCTPHSTALPTSHRLMQGVGHG